MTTGWNQRCEECGHYIDWHTGCDDGLATCKGPGCHCLLDLLARWQPTK